YPGTFVPGPPILGNGQASFSLPTNTIRFLFRRDSHMAFWRSPKLSNSSTSAATSTIPATSTAFFGTILTLISLGASPVRLFPKGTRKTRSSPIFRANFYPAIPHNETKDPFDRQEWPIRG